MRTLVLLLLLLAATPDAVADKPTAAQLAADRAELAERAYTGVKARWQAGTSTVSDVAAWSIRWLDAASDGVRGKSLSKLLAAHADRMRELEGEATKARDAGRIASADAEAATYFRIEAELWVTRGRR